MCVDDDGVSVKSGLYSDSECESGLYDDIDMSDDDVKVRPTACDSHYAAYKCPDTHKTYLWPEELPSDFDMSKQASLPPPPCDYYWKPYTCPKTGKVWFWPKD